MGVWIETFDSPVYTVGETVTPCVGVWIETSSCQLCHEEKHVTPCVGVWIETQLESPLTDVGAGHTLRGCVD